MKDRDIPKLYKYRACNEFSFAMLAKEKIWFAKPDTFNDPYDMEIKPKETSPEDYRTFLRWWGETKLSLKGASLEASIEQAFEPTGEIKPDRRKKMNEAEANANQTLANVGVLSLSMRNDSVLMWSHYAQEHKGFCIEFSNFSTNDLGKRAIEVQYAKQYPLFSSVDVITRAIGRELFVTKSEDWSYEKEWRIIVNDGNVELPFPGEMKSIIFGLKMDTKDKDRIKDILQHKHGITFKQATKVKGEFNLKIVDVE